MGHSRITFHLRQRGKVLIAAWGMVGRHSSVTAVNRLEATQPHFALWQKSNATGQPRSQLKFAPGGIIPRLQHQDPRATSNPIIRAEDLLRAARMRDVV